MRVKRCQIVEPRDLSERCSNEKQAVISNMQALPAAETQACSDSGQLFVSRSIRAIIAAVLFCRCT
jgi:hypothetical protein